MPQSDFFLADQAGSAFRAELNAALAAAVGLSSGPTAPSPSFAFQLWLKDSDGTLFIRNATNTAWLIIGILDTIGFEHYARRGANGTGFRLVRDSDGIEMFRLRVTNGNVARAEKLSEDFAFSNPAGISLGMWGSRQIFTANGTWNRPVGMTYCRVRMVGGGGGGGGVTGTTAGSSTCAGGGGGGCGIDAIFTAAEAGATRSVTVGAGGTGGLGGASVSDGSPGGTTAWGDVTASGGGGGTRDHAGGTSGSHVKGGGAAGGTVAALGTRGIKIVGHDGFPGVVINGVPACSGHGGGSMLGGTTRSPGHNAGGFNGEEYGSGGSGANAFSNANFFGGGDGFAGVIIVDELY